LSLEYIKTELHELKRITRVWSLGFGIWKKTESHELHGFGIWNLGFGIWNLELGIWDLEFGIFYPQKNAVRK